MSKKMSISTSFWFFSVTFLFMAWNLKQIFGGRSYFDLPTFLRSKIFEKSSFTRPKSPPKSTNLSDFRGDFGRVNERFFKNFELRKVVKSN